MQGYCTPPVCVPDVIGALAVWWQNTKKQIQECLRHGIGGLCQHNCSGKRSIEYNNTESFVLFITATRGRGENL